MKLRSKLLLGFSSMMVLVLIISVICVFRFRSIADISQEALATKELKAFSIVKEVDHLKWTAAVTDLFLRDDVSELTVEMDHTRCGLGSWIYSDEMNAAMAGDPELARLIANLKVPHEQLHASAVKIDGIYNDFDTEVVGILEQAWVAHLSWINTLNYSIVNLTPFEGQLDSHLCDFGTWYDGFMTQDETLKQLLLVWEEPHEALHRSAEEIVSFISEGNRDEAIRYYNSVSMPALNAIKEAYRDTSTYLNDMYDTQIEAQNVFTEETLGALGHTQSELTRLVDYFDRESDTAQAGLIMKSNQVVVLVIIISIVIVVFGILLAVFITSGILRQLGADPAAIQSIMEDVAVGKLSLNTQSGQPPVGVYSSVVNMVTALKDKADAVTRIAERDLTVEVQPAGDEDVLGQSLVMMTDNLNDMLSQVVVASEQVNIGSNQISQSSQELSQGAIHQAASLEQISATVNEVNSRSDENARKSREAADIASTAVEKAREGNKNMEQLVSAMGRINTSSDEINKIVKVIDDIAFQINLLALNANVEAARAGKFGKGFAVVAEEVRSLATRSAEAVKETAVMVEDSKKSLEQGNTIAEITAFSLQEIVEGVDSVADVLMDISQASTQQAVGINEVSGGLEQVEKVTQETSASAEESAAASEELASQATQLKSMLDQFRLLQRRSPESSQVRMKTNRTPVSIQPAPSSLIPAVVPSDVVSLDDENFGSF